MSSVDDEYRACPACLNIYESSYRVCSACRALLVPRSQMPSRPVALLPLEHAYFGEIDDSEPVVRFLLGLLAVDLAGSEEPPLTTLTAVPVFRLVWGPSFDPGAIIRVETRGSTFGLVARSSRSIRERVLPASAADDLRVALARCDLERMPFLDRDDARGCDGSSWFVETFDGARHHYVERWSVLSDPARRRLSAFADLCRTLLELSELTFAKVY